MQGRICCGTGGRAVISDSGTDCIEVKPEADALLANISVLGRAGDADNNICSPPLVETGDDDRQAAGPSLLLALCLGVHRTDEPIAERID